jgi:putative transposase
LDLITKRNLARDPSEEFAELTYKRRCELLAIQRSGIYYEAKRQSHEEKEWEEHAKARLDYWHTRHPALGSRKLREFLFKEEIMIGRRLIKRFMDEVGIYAVYPKPKLSMPDKKHRKIPYLLRSMSIFIPNQVWAVDITYIPMSRGHMYLTAIIDWHTRFIVGWALSDTLDTAPVLEAVRSAIETHGTPGTINSDQGPQFTSSDYRDYLKTSGIRQSMDGKGRWIDNVIIERWFRSLKTEYIYINEFLTPRALRAGIREYIAGYNCERPHQSLGYETPLNAYRKVFAA